MSNEQQRRRQQRSVRSKPNSALTQPCSAVRTMQRRCDVAAYDLHNHVVRKENQTAALRLSERHVCTRTNKRQYTSVRACA